MKHMRRVLAFLRGLFLGDDWRLVAAPLVALGLTTLLAHQGLAMWWLVPAAVALALAASIRQVIRHPERVR